MKTIFKEQKQKAVELMKQIDIFKPYIKGFADENQVCYYEGFGGFWANQRPELQEKLQAIEKKYNCVVYAITHEFAEFGECYSFLLVPEYKDEWNNLIYKTSNNTYYAFAYVWNVTDNYCSEFGTIEIQSFGGGIRRIA